MKKFYKYDNPRIGNFDIVGFFDIKETPITDTTYISSLLTDGFEDSEWVYLIFFDSSECLMAPVPSASLVFRTAVNGPAKGKETNEPDDWKQYLQTSIFDTEIYQKSVQSFKDKWQLRLQDNFKKKDALEMLHDGWSLGFDEEKGIHKELMYLLRIANMKYERIPRKKIKEELGKITSYPENDI